MASQPFLNKEVSEGFKVILARLQPDVMKQVQILKQISCFHNGEGEFGTTIAMLSKKELSAIDWFVLYFDPFN